MANFSHLCMNCMAPLPEPFEEECCPHCGAPVSAENPSDVLPAGTVLSERYLVGRLRHAAGDAAVYAGFDTVLKAPIVIREFWPSTLCGRNEDFSVHIVAGCEQVFQEYLTKFLSHARVVARTRDLPASIPIYDIFQENNTAYTVSEQQEGTSFEAYLQERGGHLNWEEARPLFIPLMSSLLAWHKAGVLHLGLCPDSLVLGTDGKLHVGDFAIPEARKADSELTPDLRAGYAAPEQYVFGAPVGESADVYGLSAVIFRTLSGNPPPEGDSRAQDNSDLTVPADVGGQLPIHVAEALFRALQPSGEKRLPSIAALRDRLAEAPAVAELKADDGTPVKTEPEEPEEEPEEEEEREPRDHRTLYAVIGVILAIALLILLAVLGLKKLFPDRFGPHRNDPPPAPTTGAIIISDTTASHAPNLQVPVPNLLNQVYADLRGKYVEDRVVLLKGLQYSDTVPEGAVISQTPEPGENVDITEPVYVIISAGSEYITVPDLKGWDLEQATLYVQALGLKVQVDEIPLSPEEAGHIHNTSPAKGNSVPRGSVIRLQVSTATTTGEDTPTTTEAPTTVPPTTPPTTQAPITRTPTTTTEPEEPTTTEPEEPITTEPEEPTTTVEPEEPTTTEVIAPTEPEN